MTEIPLDEIRSLIFRQDYDKARKILAELMACQKQSVDLVALSARLEGQSGNLELAVKMFEDLEAAWPERPQILKLHAEFLQEAGLKTDARNKSEELLNRFPDWREGYLLAIDSYELNGNLKKAFELCNEACLRWPDSEKLIEYKNRLKPLIKKQEITNTELTIAQEQMVIHHSHVSTSEQMTSLMLKLFKGREGVYARQIEFSKRKFGYKPIYGVLDQNAMKKHLAGDETLGIYLVKKANTCSLFVIDLDVSKQFLKSYLQERHERKRIHTLLLQIATSIIDIAKSLGLSLLSEFSGHKGMHLWAFSDFEIPARHWRLLGRWLFEQLNVLPQEINFEIFPKQDFVEKDGLGNLVKIPLGIHKASGQRSLFLEEESLRPFAEQLDGINEYQCITRSEFEEILGRITLTKVEKSTVSIKTTRKQKAKSKTYENIIAPEFELEVKIPLPERFSPEIEQVLAWCKPICEIFTQAVKNFVMTPSARHVFIYIFATLGEEGRVFLHQVLNQLPDYDPDNLNKEIKAVPPTTMSCNKVRKNLKELTARVGCNCQFRLPEGCYSSPVVHAGIYPGAGKTIIEPVNQPIAISTKELIAGPSAAIDKLMREYKSLAEEISRAKSRQKILHNQINQIFDQNGSNEIITKIGTYKRLPDNSQS